MLLLSTIMHENGPITTCSCYDTRDSDCRYQANALWYRHSLADNSILRIAHAHFDAKVQGRAIPCHTVRHNTSIVTAVTQTHLALLLRAERQAVSSHGGGQLATGVAAAWWRCRHKPICQVRQGRGAYKGCQGRLTLYWPPHCLLFDATERMIASFADSFYVRSSHQSMQPDVLHRLRRWTPQI
jgi:hypothetical protein